MSLIVVVKFSIYIVFWCFVWGGVFTMYVLLLH